MKITGTNVEGVYFDSLIGTAANNRLILILF